MASNHHGCKDLLAVIPIWHYVIQLILYNPVVCLSCTQFDLTPPPNSLTIARLVHPCLLSIQRDSIVLGRNSKIKGQEKIAPYNGQIVSFNPTCRSLNVYDLRVQSNPNIFEKTVAKEIFKTRM